MAAVTMRELLEVGAHLGHQTRRWNPKMAPFIYAQRNGIHILDLAKSAKQLEAALVAVREAAARAEGGVLIQPMSICYTHLNGIPMGRQHRPLVAWYGDLDFMPHIKAFMARGAYDAVISYGEPIAADAATDRKVLAKQVEDAVRALTSATLLGRARPVHGGAPQKAI